METELTGRWSALRSSLYSYSLFLTLRHPLMERRRRRRPSTANEDRLFGIPCDRAGNLIGNPVDEAVT